MDCVNATPSKAGRNWWINHLAAGNLRRAQGRSRWGLAMPISDSVRLGDGVMIYHRDLVNLYGCAVGAGSRVGAFVEIQKNATVGERCKISSHTFICEG